MNLTVTCTNLPPHLCFLSAELVNSLPQISGKTIQLKQVLYFKLLELVNNLGNLLEIESEIAEQWEALNITDLPDSFSDMNVQSGYFASITGFLGAWKVQTTKETVNKLENVPITDTFKPRSPQIPPSSILLLFYFLYGFSVAIF